MRDDIARWGWLRALYIRLMWLLDRTLGLQLYWITRRPLRPSVSGPSSIETCLATKKMLEPYIGDPTYNLRAAYVDDAFARGDVCVAIFADGRLAGYGWVAYQPVPHAGRIWVDFAPGQRYTTNSFTHPDFRGRHLRGSRGALETLDREHGTTHALSAIPTHNFASVRADARSGAEIIGLAGYVEIFGRFLAVRSPGAKRVGFRFHSPEGL